MPWRDLREFLGDVEERGELLHVQDEVDPKLEVGAYTLAAYSDGNGWQGPALYFDKVKGHTAPVVTNLFGTYNRYARVFDLEERTLFEGLLKRYERLVEPAKVTWGPCKEKILTGESLDLGRLPIPWWNEHDAGPYITAGCVVTKDPETGRHNVGRYRLQLKGRNKLGILVSERQHIGRHYDIARDKGQATMDVAVAIGCPPVLELASVASIPYEWEEYAWAAGNSGSGEPIEIVKGETVDLWVPATAEVVIEGKIRLGELEPEGPLGEFTGYYSGTYANPVIQVTAITHRQTPIMVGIHMASGPSENLLIGTYPDGLMLFKEIRKQLPELTGLRYLSSWFSIVAQVDKQKKYIGMARRVADCIWATKVGSYCKTIFVVDDDVDLYSPDQIFWALSVRSQPVEDVSISGNCPGYGIDPSEKEIRLAAPGKVRLSRKTSRLLWDATESLEIPTDVKVIMPAPGFASVKANYERMVTSRKDRGGPAFGAKGSLQTGQSGGRAPGEGSGASAPWPAS